jgi:phage-related tail protein
VQSLNEAGVSAKRVQEYEAEARRAKTSQALQESGNTAQLSGPSVSDAAFKKALPQSESSLRQIDANIENATRYWEAMANSMSRISNMTDAQRRIFEQMLAPVKDLESKHQILESQLRNAPSR